VKDTLRALFGKELAYVAKIDPAFVGGTRSRREYINVKEERASNVAPSGSLSVVFWKIDGYIFISPYVAYSTVAE
jgi:hypothetical protein